VRVAKIWGLGVWGCGESVAAFLSVSPCVAMCLRELQRVTVCCSVLQCVAVCCSVLQCLAVCCSVLQCVAVCDGQYCWHKSV